MSATEEQDRAESAPSQTEPPKRGGLESALADVEHAVKRVLEDLRQAARGSDALKGAESEATRLIEWLDGKAKELTAELEKVAGEVGAKAKRALSPHGSDAAGSGAPPPA